MTEQESKEQALQEYRKKLLQHKEIDAKVRTLREQVKQSKKEYDKTEDDLKALQSVGQIIAEVLRQLDEERCKSTCMPPQCLALLAQLKPEEQEVNEQFCIASIKHHTSAPCANVCN
jgi:ATP-dependent 26S proteasome regulatory subunit